MALDYTMMRDAANMAAMNRLSRAQSVGESMGTLGFLGSKELKPGGLLANLFGIKPSKDDLYDAVTTPENEEFVSKVKDYEGNEDLGTYGNSTPFSLSNQIQRDFTSAIPESTGIGPYGGGGIPAYGDNAKYDFYAQKYGDGESALDKALGSGFQLNLNKGADGKYTYGGNTSKPGSGVLDPQRGGPMVMAPEENYAVQPDDTSDTLKVNPISNALKNAQTFSNRLGGYAFGDNIAPWDPYFKDNYYNLEFDKQGRLLGDSKYAGQTKETLDQIYPTYGWTTEARGY